MSDPTRANDGINDSQFEVNTPITVVVDGVSYQYKIADAAGNMTCLSTTPPYYPVNGSSVRIQAYYPKDRVTYATTAQNFDVPADQTDDTKYKAGDLMYGKPKATWTGLDAQGLVKPTGEAVPLVFNHRMAKVRVTLTNSGLKVKSIQLMGVKRRAAYTPSSNTLGTATAIDGTTITLYNNTAGTTATTLTQTAVIPEQELTAGSEFVRVTTVDGHTLSYDVPTTTTLSAGAVYDYKFSTSQTSISGFTVTPTGTFTYDGTEKQPAVTVTGTLPSGKSVTLTEGTDYTVNYQNNINAALSTATTAPTVIVTGIGDYKDQASAKFTINQMPLTIMAMKQSISYGTTVSQDVDNVICTPPLVSGHTLSSITLTPSTESITDAGTITPSAAVIKDGNNNDVTANYLIGYKSGKLIINKGVNGLSLSATTGEVNSSSSITFTINNPTGSRLTISSSNTSVATCTPTAASNATTKTVTVRGVAGGVATITVTSAATDYYDAATATFIVTVKGPGLGMFVGTDDNYYATVADAGGYTKVKGVVFAKVIKSGSSGITYYYIKKDDRDGTAVAWSGTLSTIIGPTKVVANSVVQSGSVNVTYYQDINAALEQCFRTTSESTSYKLSGNYWTTGQNTTITTHDPTGGSTVGTATTTTRAYYYTAGESEANVAGSNSTKYKTRNCYVCP